MVLSLEFIESLEEDVFLSYLKDKPRLYIYSFKYRNNFKAMKIFWDNLSPDVLGQWVCYLPDDIKSLNLYDIENYLTYQVFNLNLTNKEYQKSRKI